MKQKTALLALIGIMLTSCGTKQEPIKVQDEFTPMEAGAVHLDGFLDDYIRHSITQWNKGVVPYASFVDFFRHGRPQFALGEMWGKAVRSGCMFYRYTQDSELKSILDATVQDVLSTQRPDGSISCSEPEQQPDGPNGDLWERKYVMLGMEEYYEWVNPDPAVLESLVKQADRILAIIPGTKMQFRVPTEDGFIRMVDYASVNNWNGKHICTWLPEVQ